MKKITIALGAYIVISSAFMLQVRNWLFKVFGDFILLTSFRLFFILIFVLMIIYAFRLHLSLFKISAISIIFILGYLFAIWQPYFSEKTHVLTYGLLGYLAANDLLETKRKSQFKNTLLVMSFVSLVSGLDEIFQGILPYRFCEGRDFITNIISGGLGAGLFLAINK